MQNRLLIDDGDPHDHRTLGAVIKWLALSGGLLGVAVLINLHPAMSADWVTLVGVPGNAASDSVQLEADASVRHVRDRVVRLRVNRAVEVESVTGVSYRSFDGTAQVDCVARQARYTTGTYYKQPNFKGRPIAEKSFAGAGQPPVRLRGFDQAHSRRVIELGCG